MNGFLIIHQIFSLLSDSDNFSQGVLFVELYNKIKDFYLHQHQMTEPKKISYK